MTANDIATIRELIQWHKERSREGFRVAGGAPIRDFDGRFHERAYEVLEKVLKVVSAKDYHEAFEVLCKLDNQ